MQKVLILGLGISGKAVAHFLLKKNIKAIGVDKKPTQIEGITTILENEKVDFRGIDCVIKSPGIAQNHFLVTKAKENQIPVLGEIDLALQELKEKVLYAVTGSNGKTTTTLFTTHLLNTAGKKAISVGNIGTPLISQIENNAEIFVVELSSFQLEHIVEKPHFDAAAILNITPNHLDRHGSFEEYVSAKLKIQRCLKNKSRFYVNEKIRKGYIPHATSLDALKEKIEPIFSLSYREKDFRYLPHDLENFSASYGLADVPIAFFEKALKTFQKPEHRVEFVREIKGVMYINDSKATSVDAVLHAVKSVGNNIILIAGGVDKGGAFSDWISDFKGKVLKVLAMGPAADRIKKELEPEINVQKVQSLEEGMKKAQGEAKAGTTILLSPGCASYDQFKNYEDRGARFKELVRAIEENHS